MTYVDGFVFTVASSKKEAFRGFALDVSTIFKDHGALSICECWGDDVPDGDITSFPMAVKKKEDETVVFSWIVWPDKQTRESGNKAVFEDPRMQAFTDMPMDGKRMMIGGFEPLVDV